MKLTKPTENDFDTFSNFLSAAENVLEKQKFGLTSAEDNWQEWDDDDEDKKLILELRKRFFDKEDIEEGEVDNRILMYLYLKHKFAVASTGWRRVYFAGVACVENCADPLERTLEYHPSIQFNHVANEQ